MYERMPDDVLVLILDALSLSELLSAASTCKRNKALAAPRLARVLRLQEPGFGLARSCILQNAEFELPEGELACESVALFADACKAGALPSCSALYFSGNNFGDAELVKLSEAFKHGALPQMTHLGLFKNKIMDRGAMALAEAMSLPGVLSNVTSLLLNSNLIGDEGVVAIARAARTGALARLETMSLSANRIGDRGAASLAEAAAHGSFKTVKYAVLERNEIGDAGMRALAEAIEKRDAFRGCRHRRRHRDNHIYLTGNPGNHELVIRALRCCASRS